MTDAHRLRCEEVIEHLLAYLDGEIDSEKRAHIDRHLEECRGCYSRAEFEKRLRNKVEELGKAEASASLRRRLHELMEEF